MDEQLRENYFLAVRMGLLLLLEIYIMVTQPVLTGASARVLLLLALLVGANAIKEMLRDRRKQLLVLVGACVVLILLVVLYGREFLLLGVYLCYEVLSFVRPKAMFYFVPLIILLAPSQVNVYVQLIITVLLAVIYIQNDFVIESYRKQTKEDTITEQYLKRDMHEREHAMQEEIRKNLLLAENQMLEERAKLSQMLHDKLGHNINGSVYQLEAVKVLMEKEPEKSRNMIQAVIDQLRTGMDEIRAILRKERPSKHKLALIQLQNLCEGCRQKGVEASLVVEGELTQVSDKYLEMLLDNAYEAVSNAMKYAKCTKIEIKIHIMNQMIRCSISDNGVGCKEIIDGMGLSGMRRRVREANGVIDFVSEAGFQINILLPL